MSELSSLTKILKYFNITPYGRVVITLKDGFEIPIDMLYDEDFTNLFGATKSELAITLGESKQEELSYSEKQDIQSKVISYFEEIPEYETEVNKLPKGISQADFDDAKSK